VLAGPSHQEAGDQDEREADEEHVVERGEHLMLRSKQGSRGV
jgi:hypothetical protein